MSSLTPGIFDLAHPLEEAMNSSNIPKILKANLVRGKTLVFRNADIIDAAFILSLRTDSFKSRHLTQTSPELSQQISWLDNYATLTDQAYFIIENMSGESVGTIRLYDPVGDSFCWGSWILKEGAPRSAAIESVLMLYSYAIGYLSFNASHFDVRKGNESVWRFHERFGAVRVGQTEQDYLYKIDKDKIFSAQLRYKKYLLGEVIVEK